MADNFALLAVLRRWWWALVVGAFLAGAAAYAIESNVSPSYRGEAKFIVGPINADTEDLGASGNLARTYSELAVSRPVLQFAIQRAGASMSVVELQETLTASANDVSRILTIEVRHPNARVAAGLANAIGRRLQELSKRDAAQNARRVSEFVGGSEFASLSPAQRAGALGAAKRLLNDSPAGRISVVQPAEPEGPAGRGTGFIVFLAMVAGAVVAGMVALVRESTGEAINDEEALEELSGVKHLGRVDAPRGRSWSKSLPAWTAGSAAAAERYRLLAFKIGFLETREPLGSLVLLDPGDGQTSGIVAGNLAAAISEAGWRVVVVDSNTTGAGLTKILRLEGSRGYTDVLGQPEDVLVDDYIESLDVGGDTPLNVLPLGSAPTVPAVDVDRVRRLLERLQANADVVLISAPPPHLVPAGLMWARVADGTLLPLDVGRTSRDDVRNTLESLSVADAYVIGTTLAKRRPLTELLGSIRSLSSSSPPRARDGGERQLAPLESERT